MTASTVVGDNVRRLRLRFGLSLRQLSELLPATHPIRFSALGELERGDRRATVDDLIALSIAFSVSPIALLNPPADLPDVPVEHGLPGIPEGTTPARLVGWLTGFRAIETGRPAARDNLPPWAWGWTLDDPDTTP